MKKKSLHLCILLAHLLFLILTGCVPLSAILPTPTIPHPTRTLPPTQTPTPTLTQTPTETLMPTETPLPTETPEGALGSTWERPKDKMVMVYIPKGVFTMGSSSGDPDEMPEHTVFLDAFWIDQTEVTYTMYAHFAGSKYGRQPVQNITWEEAAAYCAWAGSRLPTEAEWEKAARGPDNNSYPWGNQPPAGDLANFADTKSRLSWADTSVDDGYAKVAPVGNYPSGRSVYGALDMAGNLAEWVNDFYGERYYETSPQANPQGPQEGDFRVTRGGSWYSTAAGIRSADRNWYIVDGGTAYIGFRCAQSTVAP